MNKKVLCSDCGFLCWSISDLRDEYRTRIRWGEIHKFDRYALVEGTIKATEEIPELDEYYYLSCLRNQWVYYPYIKHPKYNYVDIDNLQLPRPCLYFTKYNPGRGPEEHKNLELIRDARRETRNVALLAAGVGGLISTIGNLLYNFFFS